MSFVAPVYTLTIDDLLDYGFHETRIQPDELHDRQFWFTDKDEIGKKWCALVRFWRISKYNDAARDGFDMCLMVDVSGDGLRITRSLETQTPEEIVYWCEAMWRKLGADYLSLWEES